MNIIATLTDDVSSTAKTLSPAEDDEHLLEDAVAADGVAYLEEFFYSNQHGAGVREVEMVRVSLNHNAFQHSPLAMNQAVADGFSQRFVGRGLHRK